MYHRPKRALLVIRLSRVTDATTSPERQLADCEHLCAQRGYTVVGTNQGPRCVRIRGPVQPRPNLADWLHDRHDEFDVIVVYRVDRLTRSVRPPSEARSVGRSLFGRCNLIGSELRCVQAVLKIWKGLLRNALKN
jgi:DNA invertase Pin-like site-specific DNA recombinase